jgi:hypothetical protein
MNDYCKLRMQYLNNINKVQENIDSYLDKLSDFYLERNILFENDGDEKAIDVVKKKVGACERRLSNYQSVIGFLERQIEELDNCNK